MVCVIEVPASVDLESTGEGKGSKSFFDGHEFPLGFGQPTPCDFFALAENDVHCGMAVEIVIVHLFLNTLPEELVYTLSNEMPDGE